jgi:sialic acid synthase SpsE
MKQLVVMAREIKAAIGGNYGKRIGRAESENRIAMRRSLAVSRDFKKGDALKLKDITYVRPALGVHPDNLNRVLNKRLLVNKKCGEIIFQDEIEGFKKT